MRGFIGLGEMGSRMAARLVDARLPVFDIDQAAVASRAARVNRSEQPAAA
jgi:3-hydroxyisobutyrate dehydrogenase-like beta-hydroxyacid dehydrogenase